MIAKYDLLALEARGEAVIVDWKTWRRVPAQRHLQVRLQTILYRYVLAKAGDHLFGGPIPPEKIRMIYCFVAQQGERVSIDYSAEQLRQDEAYLLKLIDAIDGAEQFPLTDNEARCRFCTYRSLCERGGAGPLDLLDAEDELEDEDFELDFDQIAEIEF